MGCSDTNWIAARATLGCLLSLVALAAASATHQGLLWIWVAMRLLNLAALGMDLARWVAGWYGIIMVGLVCLCCSMLLFPVAC